MSGGGGPSQVPEDRHQGRRPDRQADPRPAAGGWGAGIPLLCPRHTIFLELPDHWERHPADDPDGVDDAMSVERESQAVIELNKSKKNIL